MENRDRQAEMKARGEAGTGASWHPQEVATAQLQLPVANKKPGPVSSELLRSENSQIFM